MELQIQSQHFQSAHFYVLAEMWTLVTGDTMIALVLDLVFPGFCNVKYSTQYSTDMRTYTSRLVAAKKMECLITYICVHVLHGNDHIRSDWGQSIDIVRLVLEYAFLNTI